MIDDIRALVEIADSGSIVRAAGRLSRTPSAVSRKVQRLEASLGVQLLDRSAKPPRLTPIGMRVLSHARELLEHAAGLKAITSEDAEPSGLLRVGVSHALADGSLTGPISAVRARYPKVRLRLISDLTGDLFEGLLGGDLDIAAVLLPEGRAAPAPLVTNVVATDRMLIVQSAASPNEPDWTHLSALPWVLNPPGCLLRAALLEHVEQAGARALDVSAEIHNMHMQLALVASGYGLGLLPESFVRRNPSADLVSPVAVDGFLLRMTIAVARVRSLGSLEHAAKLFEAGVAAALARNGHVIGSL